MMILDGKKTSQEIKDNIKDEIEKLKVNNKRIPKLAVIIVGNNTASQTYVRNKEKACEYVGIESQIIRLDENISEECLLQQVIYLNNDITVDGILVQLPLPKHIDEQKVIETINPGKDVDGFHPNNISKLYLGEDCLTPCTPTGIFYLLNNYNYSLEGKHVVVIGRSNIVGKPAAIMALQNNATVTVCHSKTKDLKGICKTADILISAIGKPKYVDKSYIKDGCIIIDVGINRDENNKLCGDVDFESVKNNTEAITPVPGGVGPLTIAMLMKNTLKAYYNNEK